MNYWKITDKNSFYAQVLKESEENVLKALKQKESYYSNQIEIPKIEGKRTIYCVDKGHVLYRLQKNLCANFLNNIMISDVAFGFVRGYNYVDYLLEHTYEHADAYYLRVDIKNFFNSIKYETLQETLDYYFIEGESLTCEEKRELVDSVLGIVTYNEQIMQGAPSSPIISNLVFRQLDIRIDRYCSACGVRYSRYADDLLFSARDSRILTPSFLYAISKILRSKGFQLNRSKTLRSKGNISLNGYVVSSSVRLSRKKLSEINAVLFWLEGHRKNIQYSALNQRVKEANKNTSLMFAGKYDLCNYLAGYRAYIISLLKKTEDKNFARKAERMVNRIEGCLDSLLT